MAPSNASLSPRSKHYEFLGPPGALFIILAVPTTAYSLYFGCSETSGGCLPPLDTLWPRIQTSVQDKQWWLTLFDLEATYYYLAWYAFCVAAWLILPGDWVEGTLMRNGHRKQYKINGKYNTPSSLVIANTKL